MAATVVEAPHPATGAPAQPAAPELTIYPAENLTDGTAISVRGTGLLAEARYGVYQCKAGATAGGCDTTDSTWWWSTLEGVVDWPTVIRADTLLSTGEETTDCRVEGACVIALVSEEGVAAATAPLRFDPAAEPAPPPTLVVTPQTGLVPGQEVAIELQGVVWGGDIVVRQCTTGAFEEEMCDPETAQSFPSGREDRIAGTFAVSTGIFTARGGAVDCRGVAACSLVASAGGHMSPARTASTELSFDPTAPVPLPPSVVVEPNADLADGQSVALRGSGFTPGRFVGLYQCGADPHWGNCRQLGSTRPEADGSFTVPDVSLDAVLNSPYGQRDCRVAAGSCVLVATNGFANPGSRRAARTPLHFDRDGPLLPTPKLTVSPTSGLVDGSVVSVEGEGWVPGTITVQICAASASPAQPRRCDTQESRQIDARPDGTFAAELLLTEVLEMQLGDQMVDCGVTPGCAVVATQERSGRTVSVPLAFAGAAPPRRYLDPVFDRVQVTHNVVYRDTVDWEGQPVQLRMDIYQPAGDTAEKRPAIVWMHGGFFIWGDKSRMDSYARDTARRGYVGISLQYRRRPGWGDEGYFVGAAHDAFDDALAGVDWLKEHAAEYRIDPRAIVAGGHEAGALTAFNLAYMPGQRGPGTSSIAAVLAIEAGRTLGTVEQGEPPFVTFHAAGWVNPPFFGMPESTCQTAQTVEVRCDVVTYDVSADEFVPRRRHRIMRRSLDFLAETVLGPLGYLDPAEPGNSTTTMTGPDGTSDGGTTLSTAAATDHAADLPRTGSDSLRLVRLGLALAISGAALALLARRQSARG